MPLHHSETVFKYIWITATKAISEQLVHTGEYRNNIILERWIHKQLTKLVPKKSGFALVVACACF